MVTLTLKPKLAHLERSIAYQFNDRELLSQALTHRSFGATNNERLEFIGDGLVNAVVAKLLFSAHPDLDEGSLSRLRSKLVSRDGLAVIAKRFELGPLLQLGAGERKSGGRHRDSILADAVEAIAGAILMDSDFGRASDIVSAWFYDDVADLDITSTRDAKTLLQEWLQGRGHALPTYSVVSVSGEDHNQEFEVSCHTEVGDLVSYGRATSRKKAEQAAAGGLLERLINE